jgi:amino acid adenylation domain-containing protein
MHKLDRTNIRDILALTPMQAGMFFQYLKDHENLHYSEQLSLEISGTVDIDVFEKAWDVVIQTNEMLRTVFRWEDVDHPLQVILDEHKLHPQYFDLSPTATKKKKNRLEEIKITSRKETFDLREVPFKITLCKIEDDKYEMIIGNHHILYDGWSSGIILKEFLDAYNDLAAGKKKPKPVKTKFKEFINWIQKRDIDREKKFWTNYLKGLATQTRLPIKSRKKVPGAAKTENVHVRFDRDLKKELEGFVRQHKITLASLLYSAWGILLQKYTDSSDVVFGTTVSGRSAKIKRIEDIVGLFINTLPLRVQSGPAGNIENLLYKINKTLQMREAHETASLIDIKEYSEIDNKEELFDSIVIIENYPLDSRLILEDKTGQLSIDSYSMVETTHYDLTVGITLFHDIDVDFSYRRGVWAKETIARLSGHFTRILREILKDPGKPAAHIEILSTEEKKQVLYGFNQTGRYYPKEKTLDRLFAEQAARTPDSVAVVGNISVTFRELQEKSSRLAGLLRKKGAAPDTIVGLMVESSIEMVIGILGILKAGGAYLPIEPEYPQERIDYMLKDSNAAFLLTAVEILDVFKGTAWGAAHPAPKGAPAISPATCNLHLSLAYVIYTSGTTGRPKGVAVNHRGLVNFIPWRLKAYEFNEKDVTLQLLSYAFDGFGANFYSPLLSGGKLVIIPASKKMDFDYTAKVMKTCGVTNTGLVPGMYEALVDRAGSGALASLRFVVLAGEKPGESLLKRSRSANPRLRHIIEYGPTETTITAAANIGIDFTAAALVGKPIANIRIYILDNCQYPVPIYVPGEIHIAGDGLSRGYLNRPELTAERFCLRRPGGSFEKPPPGPPQNFSLKKKGTGEKNSPGRRRHILYKTGDLARWLPDGNIEFIGRVDRQVKIRGYRVELEEIEAQLMRHDRVKEAVVLAKETGTGDKYLCAYLVPFSSFSVALPLDVPGLKDYLSRRLPAYMVPTYFVFFEKIPLTANGKVDRKALPEPGIKNYEAYRPPSDEVEVKLVNIWSQVLGIETAAIGTNADFFRLGGHSLRATNLVSRIKREFNAEISLSTVFQYTTIYELANYIKKAKQGDYEDIVPVEQREYYPQSSAQKRLFFLDQFENIGTGYNIPAVLEIKGKLDKERFENTFKSLIERHETLRTSFTFVNNEPVQRVRENVEFKVEQYTPGLTGRPSPGEIIGSFVRPFNLSKAPLLRVGLVDVPDESCLLLFDMHHIISDGSSMRVLNREFTQIYAGKENRVPHLHLQYRDFSTWQNRRVETGKIHEQERYWLDLYSGQIPKLAFPTDYPRPAVLSFKGDRCDFRPGKEETAGLKKLAAQYGTTLYMNLMAVFNVLLYKYTGQEDIIIGSGIMGRPHADLHDIIGMFVNSLALRNRPSGAKSFRLFLQEVKTASLKAFENQDMQFEDLVDKLNLERAPSRNPLFDVMFTVQNFEQTKVELENVTFSPCQYGNVTSKFDMTLFTFEKGDNIDFQLEFCTDLFKPGTITRMTDHFINIIRQVTADPGIRLPEIDLPGEEEKRRLLHDFNNTYEWYPRKSTIPELFQQQVEKNPDRVAVVFADQFLTYRELSQRAGTIAAYLYFENHVRQDTPVAMLMERSIPMMEVILGILKAGGAYLPLDPSFPEERMKDMLLDSGTRVLISRKRYIKTLNRLQWECPLFYTFLCVDSTGIYGEEEREESELMDKKLWEYVGQGAGDEITGGGWLSSYTGKPIPKAEMGEYGDNILKKLTPLLHNRVRVLEVGCASGITMYRIAPKVGFYYGCDLSAAIIEKNRQRIRAQGHRNIVVDCLPAHEIDRIKEKDFHLVILNSVIQCFNGHNYLRKVIRKAVDKLGEKGYFFIGDVMDRELKKDLIKDLEAFKRAHKGKEYTTKTDWSTELFVSKNFFRDLTVEIPGIRKAEFSPKVYTIENELTRFRYDVLLTIDKKKKIPQTKTPKQKHKYQHDASILEKYRKKKVPSTNKADGGQLAYIIYTSGSTGKPKGTLTTHANVIRVVRNTNYIRFTGEDRVLQLSNYAFDGSVFDIYGALLNGAALVMLKKEDVLALDRLSALIVRERITVFFVTTALFNALVDIGIQGLKGVRKVLFGGERVSVEHAAKARHYLGENRVIHVYGPTETTVYATYYNINHIDPRMDTIPIGSPISNTFVYILDPRLKIVPIGVNGELYIGGDGTARGYLNRPGLTREKFLRGGPGGAVFSKSAPPGRRRQKIYKTGDLARWLWDGNIEFIGRVDHQVKIRGFRIEPGEIESRLLKYHEIKKTFVTARENASAERYLCAYIAADVSGGVDVAGLKEDLHRQLPDFMVPAYFVLVDDFPLTPNGKIDIDKLPDPEAAGPADGYTAPRNPLEEKMAALWADVLGVDQRYTGIDSDFFELGGHSLKATLLVSKIQEELHLQVPLAEVFRTPTIRGLSGYLKKAPGYKYAVIQPLEEKEYYPLSSSQKRLYVLQQLEANSIGYNVPRVFLVEEVPDKTGPEAVLKALIQRHESLRTSFHLVNEEPVQKIHKFGKLEFEIEYKDLTAKTREDTRREAEIHRFVRPFDLSAAPLLRVGMIKLGEKKHIVMLDMHHIITDGTSIQLFAGEFSALYDKPEKTLAPLRIQYKDFARWQNSEYEKKAFKEQENSWMKVFERGEGGREIPVLNLPFDYPRPALQAFAGSLSEFVLGPGETQRLNDLAKQMDVTLFMTLLAIFNVFLSKLGGQQDIIVGTPVAGRRHADLQPIMGMFVNTLALRHFPTPAKTFVHFLQEVKTRTLQAFENQEYPFEELVEKVEARRDISRNPLFDVMFALHNQVEQQEDEPDAGIYRKLKPYEYENPTSKFDLSFHGIESAGKITFSVEYCTRLFKAETIRVSIDYFKNIVSSVLENPHRQIRDIDLFEQREKQRILEMSMGIRRTIDRNRCIHELFEDQVERMPDGVALVGSRQLAVGESVYLTYRELNEKSDQSAHMLRTKGIGPGTIVGIMAERSLETIIAIMGILKAGGAYLPIDADYPEERIDYMLADSGAKILLTNLSAGHHINFSSSRPSNLAYVMYTSGTTGKPRGVMMEHRSLVNLVLHQFKYTGIDFSRVLQFAPIGFDVSFQEIFSTLLWGGTIYLINPETRGNVEELFSLVAAHHIKTLFLPPAFLKFITREENRVSIPAYVDHIAAAGEQLVVDNRLKQVLRQNRIRLHNHYGPTEAHVVTILEMDPEDEIPGLPSIGKPIMNTDIWIFVPGGDGRYRLQPPLVPGELYIGGVQVSRGYLNQPELTAERFCLRRPGGLFSRKLPPWTPRKSFSLNKGTGKRISFSEKFCGGPGGGFSKEPPGRRRLYKTGDLARWLLDGNIEFLGRADSQVKIRGFRIEPGEIETRLMAMDIIKEAVVLPKEHNGEKHLCAYMVPASSSSFSSVSLDPAEIRKYLSDRLPGYMVPSYFITLDRIPLTANGKVDRIRLPEPGLTGLRHYTAPGNKVEEKLVNIWSGVLNGDVGIDDNFFELGGHSLKATLVTARIHKELKVKIPPADVFKHPTIRELARELGPGADKTVESAVIDKAEQKEYYPLSPAQKRLFILWQMDEAGTVYNMPSVSILEGNPDRSRLERAFKTLIRRHESLRTSFHIVHEEPVQVIHDNVEFEVRYDEAQHPVVGDFIRFFELSQAPLLRVGLIKIETAEHLLMVDMHHIVSDGVSIGILVKDFMKFYAGESLPPVKIQYKDFAQWQNRVFQDGKENREKKQMEAFWLGEFAGEVPLLNLPGDYPRSKTQDFAGSQLTFRLDPGTKRAVERTVCENRVTPYMVFLSIYYILLWKLGGQDDIVVGTPAAGRRYEDLQQVIGMFVNTLPLRTCLSGEKSFSEFLREVREKTLQAFENQDYPFEELVEKVGAARLLNRNPLFDVMFSLQNRENSEIRLPGLKLKPYSFENPTSKFDLGLRAAENEEGFSFTLDYCTALFKKETVRRFIAYFKKIAAAVLLSPRILLSYIEIITGEEKNKILYDFNRTEAPYPVEKTIHELFNRQVERTPDRLAVLGYECMDAWMHGEVHITYRELNERSGQLAYVLRTKGTGPDTIVGLTANRSVETITGILGILKAGGAYLPIDPDYPQERIDYMLADSGAKILLTNLSEGHHIDPPACQPSNLAYVIYTSGTTGRPKGTAVMHRSVINLVSGLHEKIYSKYKDKLKVGLLASFGFDASVKQIFAALLSGQALVIAPGDIRAHGQQLLEFYRRKTIDISDGTPLHLDMLLDAADETLPGLTPRHFIIGGETLPKKTVERFFNTFNKRELKITNIYGLTECTVDSTLYDISIENIGIRDTIDTIPIGCPMPNVNVYILDSCGQLAPHGVTGELYIGGAGLARGCLNQPELTAKSFLSISYKSYRTYRTYIPEKIYKTGDLGRWLADGNIEFLGRIDHQVKIRGFRIELGEIESQLLNHAEIKDSVVIVRMDGERDTYLCAYIVSDSKPAVSELRGYLSQNLPVYMIPSYFVLLDRMPLTPSRKIDRSALPEPTATPGETYTAPRDDREQELVKIWSEVLGIEKEIIGIDSNFFELGGHSLKATLLTVKIHKKFNVKFPLTRVFLHPTIRKMSADIMRAGKHRYAPIEPVEKKEYYPLSSVQKRLYFLQQMDPESTGYNMPFVLPVGKMEMDKIEAALNNLVKRHESLRTSFINLNDEPVQKIHDHVEFEIEYHDIAAESTDCQLPTAFLRPFDLSKPPLLRVCLIKSREKRYFLLMDMHHITSDGVSIDISTGDFKTFYRGEELPVLHIQYKDFCRWQNSEKEKEKLEQQAGYWLKEFEDEIPVLNLPTDYPRPSVQSFEGNLMGFSISIEDTAKLKTLAILLAKLSSQEDIVIGTPVAGRRHEDLRKIIGMFVNTLALRNYPSGEKTFEEFLEEVKTRTLEAFENQEYPFEELVEKVTVNRDLSRNPVFDVLFVLQNLEIERGSETGRKPSLPEANLWRTSKFDLSFIAVEARQKLIFSIEYSTRLFKKETIERFFGYLRNIISSIPGDPGISKKLGEIEIISKEEKERILYGFNDTKTDYPGNKTIHELFAEQANRTPDGVAIVGSRQLAVGKKENVHFSYNELNERSNQLAQVLREKGVLADSIVGIMMGRSLEMITGLLGILKAGGAYLPIDPDYPQERIDYMLTDSGAKVLVNTRTLAEEVEKKFSTSQPLNFSTSQSSNLAYVIYTSGSTGQPKGVLIQHRGVVNMVWFHREIFKENPGSHISQVASPAFDAMAFEVWPCLLGGAALYIIDNEIRMHPGRLKDWLIRYQVTISFQPTLMARELLEEQWPETGTALEILRTAGERLNRYPTRSYPFRFYNLYGPTEDTIWTTWAEIPMADSAENLNSPPLGKPVANKQVYILSSGLKPQPVGVVGELCISGNGLARGYLNRPELTAEKFDHDDKKKENYQKLLRGVQGGSFLEKSPPGRRRQKLYKTGDLARWLEDGNIEFIGRKDFQVKIRGFRIELGEIESRLEKYKGIREAVVLAKEGQGGETYLCAYIVPFDDCSLSVPELREHLSQQLPGYMIPSYFVQLDKVPLNPSGKIDRRALSAYKVSRIGLPSSYTAPGSRMEKSIAGIWKEVLQLEEVGIHDNFFEIGGNSINLLKVQGKLKNVLGIDIPVVKLFKYSTILSLTRYLQGEKKEQEYLFPAPGEEKKTGIEVAVIGICGIFPGARDIHEFWENLKNGVEAITFFTDEELEGLGVTPVPVKIPNYVRAAGIIDNAEYFDASFFDYTPREAQLMDPQIRIFHQCVWHALEDAAYDPYSYPGRVGLYAGATANVYWQALTLLSGVEQLSHTLQAGPLGNKDFMCTRISYKLDLKGPSFSIQTACSTSLAAIHLAVRGLIDGECEMALAGGVTISYPQKTGHIFHEGMIHSPDGHCRAFDVDSNGMVGGNGAGVAVLKRYKDAIAARDNIYAVIKGSAVNNDGIRKVGYTAPGVDGQVQVIRAALAAAGVEPESITYIEAHGTGTELGDAVEIEALKMVFNKTTTKKRFCRIGSVKTNVGHLDAAAGAASFIKTVLALKHRLIPPNLHFKTPNPKLDLENSPFLVVSRLTGWKTNGFPLRAGVSSLGVGGTNAHVILEEAPLYKAGSQCPPSEPQECQLILLSAKTDTALEKVTQNLVNHFKENPAINLADAAYTLQVGRKSFPCRRMTTCKSVNEAADSLSPAKNSREVRTFFPGKESPAVVFIFPGQGDQYINMGRDLYEKEPVFREEMNYCFKILTSLVDYNVKEVLYPQHNNLRVSPGIDINRIDIAQPILFAFEYSLAKLLMKWGIQPRAMIGYSLGEFTAACISGVFSLEDALKLVTRRAQLIQEKTPEGAMLSVPLPEQELKPLLNDNVSLANINGPSCIVAGSIEAIGAFEKEMKNRKLLCTRLNIPRAGHSLLMNPIREEFEDLLKRVKLSHPLIPYLANVTGNWITHEQAVDTGYWLEHLCAPVRFARGVEKLLQEDNTVFLEIGPGRGSSNIIRQHPHKKTGQTVVNLIRHQRENVPDDYYLLNKIGHLWLCGIEADWAAFHTGKERYRISLPPYPFEGKPFRLDDSFIKKVTGLRFQPAGPGQETRDSAAASIPAQEHEGENENYAAPRNELEQNIARIWQQLLGFERIDIYDNFFHMNGDSLTATQVVARLREIYPVEVPLKDFFEKPTIAHLAQITKKLLIAKIKNLSPEEKKRFTGGKE